MNNKPLKFFSVDIFSFQAKPYNFWNIIIYK